MAHLMREIYAEQFRDAATPLPEIISVPGEEFYGEGYDDSDRRIPDIEKARTLLAWEPRLSTRETFETTMRHHVIEYRNSRAVGAARRR